jgi:hypothetical protein
MIPASCQLKRRKKAFQLADWAAKYYIIDNVPLRKIF